MNISKRLIFTTGSAAAIGVIAIVGFAYSGIYDVSAGSSHSSMVNWLLSTTSHASIARRAKDIEVPNLSDDAMARAGVNDFNGMCAGCHGAPGRDPEAMGQGLNPPPPDLAESAAEMSPAELFWVTKNGIKMTGMPEWGATHDDDAIWPVVALMTRLPELNASQYQELIDSAGGMGHHANDSPTEGHPHEDSPDKSHPHGESEHSEDTPAEPEEHDHSTHEH
ncbi:MAG: cytochrome c [Proteobacteria bacterium]|nr:cytochrome c [Pseudomonadota bacterium]